MAMASLPALLGVMALTMVYSGAAGATECQDRGGMCLHYASTLVCHGTRYPGWCQSSSMYCCVPPTHTQGESGWAQGVAKVTEDTVAMTTPGDEACRERGGVCQAWISALACGGDKLPSLCGNPALYCCVRHHD